ncbi:AMP-binding enzyme [Saccharopolyspora spinosa]|uniref:AMP-binding enzyme n=1 Tax=Saccharopolyspora spinosa TaxID=60894 RepID=UPI001ED8C8F2|nr:hypothetical protein [Saccharopolyspora spinosa]
MCGFEPGVVLDALAGHRSDSWTRRAGATWTKDMINAASFKVRPREVEDVRYGHPAVREVAVVGVPDSYRGETVKAYVGLSTGASATAAELVAYCKQQLAAYKYPRSIEILDELPKTATGKILRRQLPDTARDASEVPR